MYEITDKKEEDTYKYGISGQKLDEDNTSDYVEKQTELLNDGANEDRYKYGILLKNIESRQKALQLEDDHILDYEGKNGHFPRGNKILNTEKESRERHLNKKNNERN